MTASSHFTDIAASVGLPVGRLVSFSKSAYHALYPDNAVVFNSTLADLEGNRLWWGDVDLTDDEATLVELARRSGRDLRLYFEGDSRPGFVKTIDPARAVVAVSPDGRVTLGTWWPLKRDSGGRIVREQARAGSVDVEPEEARDDAEG